MTHSDTVPPCAILLVAAPHVCSRVTLCYVLPLSSLASKLDLRSFKLHFIEHTTDVLVRSSRAPSPRNNQPMLAVRQQRRQQRVSCHAHAHASTLIDQCAR